jgi:hypothetical protein
MHPLTPTSFTPDSRAAHVRAEPRLWTPACQRDTPTHAATPYRKATFGFCRVIACGTPEGGFEFRRGHDRFVCELRDHGGYGVEAQFFLNEEFFTSRRFDRRSLAVRWEELERNAIEHEGPGA